MDINVLFEKSALLILCVLISCSSTNSNSDSNTVSGTVKNESGSSLESVQVGVAYSFGDIQIESDLRNYPNPFRGSTTIHFELNKQQNYRLEAVNLKTEEKTVILDDVFDQGIYETLWDPSDNSSTNELYELTDNLGNQAIAFSSFTIPIEEEPGTLLAGNRVIGEFFISTDKKGKFEFSKDLVFSTKEEFAVFSESDVKIGGKIVLDEVYIVAYLTEQRYDVKLINIDDLNSSLEFDL